MQDDQIIPRSVLSYAASPGTLKLVGNNGHYAHQWTNDRETENRWEHTFMGWIKLCSLSVLFQTCSCVCVKLARARFFFFFAVSKV